MEPREQELTNLLTRAALDILSLESRIAYYESMLKIAVEQAYHVVKRD
jgi:hypothetical protein